MGRPRTRRVAVGGVEIEQEGEIGAGFADGEFIDEIHGGEIEAPGDALVDGGGIEEAIRDDPGAGGEGGLDDLADQLRAAGGEEEQLGLRDHAAAFLGELEQVADGLAEGRAAGLAGEEDGVAGLLQPGGEAADLRGFTAAFRAFEGDEDAVRTGHGRGDVRTSGGALSSGAWKDARLPRDDHGARCRRRRSGPG